MAKRKKSTTRSQNATRSGSKAAGQRSGATRKQTTTRKGTKGSGPSTDGKDLVVVESPAKARTINKYLGNDYVVMASVGHVRDLPKRNPKGVNTPVPGVDLEDDFRPTYEVLPDKKKTVNELARAAKNARGLWLATDLDREGEAIAWHIAEAVGVPVEQANRVVFNAITQREVTRAFSTPREIDFNKVNAQQARRVLDRIVGYQVSPLLWKKVAGGLSAGRVQSVAVRLIVEREREIQAFVPEEHWKLTAYLTIDRDHADALRDAWFQWLEQAAADEEGGSGRKGGDGPSQKARNAWLNKHQCLAAELAEVNGERASLKSADEATDVARRLGLAHTETKQWEDPKGQGPARNRVRVVGRTDPDAADWRVRSVQTKRTRSRPYAPFITSTLQQQAANQLGFAAQQTMRVAQQLYEGVEIGNMGAVGLITYMRTDSTNLSEEAVRMVRDYIGRVHGDAYLPNKPNVFRSSNQEAQEAHEAIHPTDVTLTPKKVRSSLNDQQYKLYKLIWERFVACQMVPAEWDATTVHIVASAKGEPTEAVFKCSGRRLVFDGFYRATGVPNVADELMLPAMQENQPLALLQLDPTQHFTSPPPRYSEAALVKKLEAEGIGRPSTYAQIIQVIQDRKYVEKMAGRFHATDLGMVVTDKLTEAFPSILDVGYTREMEAELDQVESARRNWRQMLRAFYAAFRKNLDQAYEGLSHAKAETQDSSYECPECGSAAIYRFGRNGRFLSCSRYPQCKYAAPVDREGRPQGPERTDIACPKCGSHMALRKGRYGPFLSCENYPDCDGLLNLDKEGRVRPPKPPPLQTDLTCPKCSSPLNLRRGKNGPWLSCSKFPKCRGRLSWTSLDESVRNHWEKALGQHERANPQPTIRTVHGDAVGESHKPQVLTAEDDQEQGSVDAGAA